MDEKKGHRRKSQRGDSARVTVRAVSSQESLRRQLKSMHAGFDLSGERGNEGKKREGGRARGKWGKKRVGLGGGVDHGLLGRWTSSRGLRVEGRF